MGASSRRHSGRRLAGQLNPVRSGWLLAISLFVLLTVTNQAVARVKRRPHFMHRCLPTEMTGTASWYGLKWRGRRMANGHPFNPYALSAASRTIPLGSLVRVTSIRTRRQVLVRIADRGPYINCRVIDLSLAAARVLGFEYQGVTPVELEVIAER